MMLSRLLRFVALAALALGGRILEAQEPPAPPAVPPFPRFEMSVMAGYRFEGDLPSQDESSPYTSIVVDNAPTFGFTLGYYITPILEAEVQYSYANPAATALGRVSDSLTRVFHIGVQDIQLAPIINFGLPTERVRVFFGFGIGTTILNATEGFGDSTLASFSVSLGVKAFLSEHVGLRAEFHYVPAYLFTTGDGVELCFDSGGCWNTGDRYLQQVDFRAGATFRF